MGKVTDIPVDKKYNEYQDAYADIKEFIYDRCDGVPLVAVLGILELIKDDLKE